MMGYGEERSHSWGGNHGNAGRKTKYPHYLKNAALPDAKSIPQQVKVGPSDLHVLYAAHIGPGHHLSPNEQTDGCRKRQTGGTHPRPRAQAPT